MKRTFLSPFIPLDPPHGCWKCETTDGIFGYYDERWWCPKHFFSPEGPGRSWPKAERVVA